MELSEQHQAELREAKRLLEHPGYVARLTDLIGTPIDMAIKRLPAPVTDKIAKVTNATLTKTLSVATSTMRGTSTSASPKTHSLAVALSGAAGGAFGLAGLAFELPVSTMVMMRSIADIARANGEQVTSDQTQLACLMVFSLGGKSSSDDASESGYYAARMALAKAMSDASAYLARHGAVKEGAPALVRLITQIATRFNIQVSQKAAAMMVPILGAAGGAVINTLFINHFQDMARGHFTVRRLERVYGEDVVRTAFLAMNA